MRATMTHQERITGLLRLINYMMQMLDDRSKRKLCKDKTWLWLHKNYVDIDESRPWYH